MSDAKRVCQMGRQGIWVGIAVFFVIALGSGRETRSQSRQTPETPTRISSNSRATTPSPSPTPPEWPGTGFASIYRPPDVHAHRTAGTNLPDVSRRVVTLTNEERTARGRQALTQSKQLTRIACRHNKDMFAHGYAGHEDADGRRVGARLPREHRTLLVRRRGENVFQASGEYAQRDDLAPVPMKWWMDSPGHRENILRPQYTHLGACVTRKDDEMRSTQVFANVAGELEKPLPWSMSAGDSLVTTVHSPRPDIDFERYGFRRVDTDEELAFEQTAPFNGTIRIPSKPGRYELKMIYKNVKDEGPSYLYSTGPRIRVTVP